MDHNISAEIVGEMDGLVGKAMGGGQGPSVPLGVVTAILMPDMTVIPLAEGGYLFVPIQINMELAPEE